MDLSIGYITARGPSLESALVLAGRYAPASDDEGAHERALLRWTGQGFRRLWKGRAIADVWSEPHGGVVAAAGERVFTWDGEPGPTASARITELDGWVSRIDGVGGDLLFAYGASERAPMFCRRAGRWESLPSPGFVLRVHGVDPSLVYAVGARGLIARWTGSQWQQVPSRADGVYRDVCVVSADEMYAVHEDGLWEGSVHGWGRRLPTPPGTLLSVAHVDGVVVVGTLERGLCRLDGGALVPLVGGLSPLRLEASGTLLAVQPEAVAEISTSHEATTLGLDALARFWADEPLPEQLR